MYKVTIKFSPPFIKHYYGLQKAYADAGMQLTDIVAGKVGSGSGKMLGMVIIESSNPDSVVPTASQAGIAVVEMDREHVLPA